MAKAKDTKEVKATKAPKADKVKKEKVVKEVKADTAPSGVSLNAAERKASFGLIVKAIKEESSLLLKAFKGLKGAAPSKALVKSATKLITEFESLGKANDTVAQKLRNIQ